MHKPLTGTPVRRVLAYERYLTDLIDQRRAEPRDDLISMVVQAIDSGQAKLSLPELVSVLNINLVVAGHETTVIGIGNALHYLLTNREHWQALIDDPGLIPNAAEELLRLDGVLLGFFRTTTEAVEVRGVTIPRGVRAPTAGASRRCALLCVPGGGVFPAGRGPEDLSAVCPRWHLTRGTR